MAQERHAQQHVPRAVVAPYLQINSVLSGISDLLTKLMGIQLVPQELAPREGWAPGVQKLLVVSESKRQLGTLYVDTHMRGGKLPGSLMFPIRCGRQLPGMRVNGWACTVACTVACTARQPAVTICSESNMLSTTDKRL